MAQGGLLGGNNAILGQLLLGIFIPSGVIQTGSATFVGDGVFFQTFLFQHPICVTEQDIDAPRAVPVAVQRAAYIRKANEPSVLVNSPGGQCQDLLESPSSTPQFGKG